MLTTTWGKGAALLVALAIIGAACSSDDGGGDETAGDTAPAEATTTTTVAAAASAIDPARAQEVVETLADDDLEGRDNQTPGSEASQAYLVELLAEFTDPLDGDSLDGYGHTFAAGTNLLGVIPGEDLAEEYVVLGAHYDHIGRDCITDTPGDEICNGAADNASGVATVLEVGRSLAGAEEPPRRSVIVALWDAEEDGLLGAEAYVQDPPVPLEDTITYLNWDIQGSNLSPALAGVTVMVGAETGGPNLQAAATTATEASGLETLALSLLFGQGRSDHAVFADAGVPIVFFTDANTPCYHTSQDDLANLDFDKLGQQMLTAEALAQEMVATDDRPEYDPTAPPATYEDAISMLGVVSTGEADFDLFDPEAQAAAEQFLIDLNTMVDAGEAAFDDDAVSTLLGGSVTVVDALSTGTCDGFLS